MLEPYCKNKIKTQKWENTTDSLKLGTEAIKIRKNG